MPYQSNWEQAGVHVRLTGQVTGLDIKQVDREIYGHETFDGMRYTIYDFTQAEDFSVSLDEMREVAAMDLAASTTNPNLRIALVAATETVRIANSVYETAAPELPWDAREFDTLNEARRWLEGA
jgi:hypothetical protein